MTKAIFFLNFILIGQKSQTKFSSESRIEDVFGKVKLD